jgi:hypothetical protein
MKKGLTIGITILAAIATPVSAQNLQRRATMVGGGSPDRGKCTIEVVVDGGAEVEIRGDTATLRDLKGQIPQWRRFECTGVMPNNPMGFRFAGVDGRGSQQLVRDPRNGGVAVVRIQDPDNGAEGYTFDIMWGGAGAQTEDRSVRGPEDRDRDRGGRQRFSQDDAMRSCQDAVRQQAAERFNARDIAFRRVEATDNPGPRDSVNGVFDVRREGRDQAFRFSCSVNFDSGRVWNAAIEPLGGDHGGQRDDRYRGDRDVRGNPGDRAIGSCQRAVEERIARDGFGDVRIESIRVDDRPGRNDWVIGDARADSRNGRAAFTFSCSVDLADGDVRSVDVRAR